MASISRETVRVALRVRPLNKEEEQIGQEDKECIEILNKSSVVFTTPQPKGRDKARKRLKYTFSRVFDKDSSQVEVYQDTTQSLVEDVLAGNNALLFTYGITNSGKTYTMQGTETEGGVLSRSLDIIFNSIYEQRAEWFTFKPDKQNNIIVQPKATAEAERAKIASTDDEPLMHMSQHDISVQHNRSAYDPTQVQLTDPDCRYAVFVSYVEIYKELIFDLLDETPIRETSGWNVNTEKIVKETKSLREDKKGQVFVSNVKEVEVHSTEEAYELMHQGQKARQVAATCINAESSRSHSVFNIRIVKVPLNKKGSDILRSKKYPPHVSQFSLVDLAGSERTSKTNSKGERRKEAGDINKSLMTLRRCMLGLRDNSNGKKKTVIPFRESLLTKLFKHYFVGNGKVAMIVCVSPSVVDEEETAHVLKFSALTQSVTTKVEKTPVKAPQGILKASHHKADDAGLTPGRGKKYREAKAAGRDIDVIVEAEAEEADNEFKECIAALKASTDEGDPSSDTGMDVDSDDIDGFDIASMNLPWFKPLLKAQNAFRQSLQDKERLLKKQRAILIKDQEELAEREADVETLKKQVAERKKLESHKIEQRKAVVASNDHTLEEMRLSMKNLKEQSKFIKSKIAQRCDDRTEIASECKQEEQALTKLQAEEQVLSQQLDELKEFERRALAELDEKENLAQAETNKMEIELGKALQEAEQATQQASSNLERQRKANAKLAYKLDMVKDVFQSKTPEKRRRSSSASPRKTRSRRRVEESKENAEEDTSKMDDSVVSVQAFSTNNPELDQRRTGRPRTRSGPAPKVLGHKPRDFQDTDTIMSPVVHAKHYDEVASPTVDQLMTRGGKVKHDKYVLNHQDNKDEHVIYKGEINPSVTKTGVSVTFTGLETLTTAPTLAPIQRKRRGRSKK